ncbi:MAG: FAD-binding oxidoreductase [Nanoarchaeota archaeon]|nr:FAD-binding oxidoreductase [Nanoarchaeota archaeon]
MEKEVTVTAIIQETADTKTFKLGIGGEELNYQPGQFIIISTTLEGKPINRSYSISNAPIHDSIDITIKAEPNGFFSVYANDHIKKGDKFLIKGPFGKFTFKEETNDLLLIAAGSGIAPMKAIIEYIMSKELENPVTLLFSNKTTQDIIFKETFEHYEKKYEHFTFVPFITRETTTYGVQGHIDKEHLQPHITPNTLCYICGPPTMVDAIKIALNELGVPEQRIKVEKFG